MNEETLFQRYLEGELSPPEEAELLELLKGDAAAADRLAALLRLDEGLRELTLPEGSPEALARAVRERLRSTGQTDRFAAQVVERIHRPRRGSRLRGGRGPALLLPALIAAGFAVAILLFLVFQPSEPPARPVATPKGAATEPAPAEPIRVTEPTAPPPTPAPQTAAVAPVTTPEPVRPPARPPEKPAPPAAERAPEPQKPPTPAPKVETTVSLVASVEAAGGEAVHVRKDLRRAAAAGSELLPGDGLETGPKSWAVVKFPDGTRVEVGSGSVLAGWKAEGGKRAVLSRGSLMAVVSKQPAPLVFSTPHGDAAVLGTTLRLVVDETSTRLEVVEGKVRLTRSDGKAVDVGTGHFAVAATGMELAARALPVWRQLRLDPGAGQTQGDGNWTVEGRSIKQVKVSRLASAGGKLIPDSTVFFPAPSPGNVRVEATVTVDDVTPDLTGGVGAWGFGVAVRCQKGYAVFRSLQNSGEGWVAEFVKDLPSPSLKSIPYRHERSGAYQVKLLFERRKGKAPLCRGKIWKQGEREPEEWTLEAEVPLEGPALQAGLHTVRSACTFSQFKVEISP